MDKFTQAASVARKLDRLDKDELDAIAAAPAEIRDRFAARKARLVDALPDEIAKMVSDMRIGSE